MNKLRQHRTAALTALTYVLVYGLVLLLIVSALEYRQKGPVLSEIVHLDTVSVSVDSGPWETLSLPHTFQDLAPQTPVTIRATIRPDYDDCVYLKTVYAPAKLYLDGHLAYALGQPDSYPAYFADPPAEIRLAETHGSGEDMDLQVDFTSPDSRNPLVLLPLMVGSSKEIIFHCASQQAAPMILAMVQIIVGCVLLIVSLFLMLLHSRGQVFFWLGLFSKFSGIWFLCDNNFSVFCFRNDSLLYLLAFTGCFSFLIPLLRFLRLLGNCRDSKLLTVLEFLSAAAAITAMVLQFTGVVDFSRSMQFFRLWIPLVLLLAAAVVASRALRKNVYAGRLLLPMVILTGSALPEMYSPSIHLASSTFPPFQIGACLFLFLITIIAGLGLKDSIELKKKADLLEQEKHILSIQTQEHRTRSLLLAQNEQELSRQRHDLRHQLAAIQELSGENQDLQAYLETLIRKIPRAAETYCENRVVNAILSHFAARCQQEGVHLTTRLTVPETGSQDRDSDLCVIFANLLENAVEACGRMETGEKYIHLSSILQGEMLTIAMENSFSGSVNRVGGRFRSSKREDYGIGLSSIQAIAEAAHGSADFQPHGGMFHSTVFLRL